MWFVGIGLLALVLKLAGLPFMALLPWWAVALPFGAAVVWWYVADQTGYTQRRAMEAEAERARAQRERRYEALGMRVTRGQAAAPGAPAAPAPHPPV